MNEIKELVDENMDNGVFNLANMEVADVGAEERNHD